MLRFAYSACASRLAKKTGIARYATTTLFLGVSFRIVGLFGLTPRHKLNRWRGRRRRPRPTAGASKDRGPVEPRSGGRHGSARVAQALRPRSVASSPHSRRRIAIAAASGETSSKVLGTI